MAVKHHLLEQEVNSILGTGVVFIYGNIVIHH
jgi:hypothetical protein